MSRYNGQLAKSWFFLVSNKLRNNLYKICTVSSKYTKYVDYIQLALVLIINHVRFLQCEMLFCKIKRREKEKEKYCTDHGTNLPHWIDQSILD